MLLERGIVVSYETIRRWAIKFGADYARRLKRKAPTNHDIWHLDEVVITIHGEKRYRWQSHYCKRFCKMPPRDIDALSLSELKSWCLSTCISW